MESGFPYPPGCLGKSLPLSGLCSSIYHGIFGCHNLEETYQIWHPRSKVSCKLKTMTFLLVSSSSGIVAVGRDALTWRGAIWWDWGQALTPQTQGSGRGTVGTGLEREKKANPSGLNTMCLKAWNKYMPNMVAIYHSWGWGNQGLRHWNLRAQRREF